MRPARVAARAVPAATPTSVLSSPPPSPPEEGVELPGIPVKMKTRLKHPSMKALPAPTQLPAMGPPSSRNFLPALTKGKAVRGAGSSNVDTSTELATFNTPNTDAPLRLRADSPDPTDTLDPIASIDAAAKLLMQATNMPMPQKRRRGSVENVVHGRWTEHEFSLEARSHEWQDFACVWNEIVRELRHGDLLSNAEKKELLFYSLGRGQVDAFFGVEYIIFPTMLTGPVFFTPVLEGGFLTSVVQRTTTSCATSSASSRPRSASYG